jgi:hypothetical protein
MTRQKSTQHYKCRRMQGAAGSFGRPSTVHVECLNVCLWAEGLHTRSHPRNPIAQRHFVPCVGQGATVFVSIIPKYMMHWSNIGTSLKVPLLFKLGFCIRHHKQPFPLPRYCGIDDPPRSASVMKKWKCPFVNVCYLPARHLPRNF